jgi:hypothetical protein
MPMLSLLQLGGSPLMSDMLKVSVISAVVMLVVIVAVFYIFRSMRKSTDAGVKAQLDAEFEKTKDALLLAAAAKRARSENDETAKRELAADAKERELLRENIDMGRVIGQTDPLSSLEMMEDMELIVDPYTGQGYLLPSFLNDWPPGQDRPKYVYRHPQGTVVKSSDLVKSF